MYNGTWSSRLTRREIIRDRGSCVCVARNLRLLTLPGEGNQGGGLGCLRRRVISIG